KINPARLVEPAPARVGSRLTLALDVSRVRTGMLTLVRDDRDRIVSQAVVEDISEEMVRARITQLHRAITTIDPSMRFELAGTKLRWPARGPFGPAAGASGFRAQPGQRPDRPRGRSRHYRARQRPAGPGPEADRAGRGGRPAQQTGRRAARLGRGRVGRGPC